MRDFYLRDENAMNRLYNEWLKHKSIIIAYDFDETVFDYHEQGHSFEDVMKLLRRWKKIGADFIVFTAATDERLESIKTYLDDSELPYDVINENMPYARPTGRKIYYNILLDDRAGLSSAYEILLAVADKIERSTDYVKDELY